jgi:hypothetical protein
VIITVLTLMDRAIINHEPTHYRHHAVHHHTTSTQQPSYLHTNHFIYTSIP